MYSIEYCATSTGDGSSQLVTRDCLQGEACQQSATGATCHLVAQCLDGQTQCANGTTIQTCTHNQWVTSTCSANCIRSSTGAFCGLDETTKTLTGTLQYEARGPNGTPPTDWGAIVTVPAQGFTLLVERIGTDGTVQLIDSQVTAEGGATPGAFSVTVPNSPLSTDYLVAVAAGTIVDSFGNLAISYAVGDPDLAGSSTPYPSPTVGASPKIWNWSLKVSSAVDGGTITIPETSTSGAARVFDYARFIFESDQNRFGSYNPFIIWIGSEVKWSCGACNTTVATDLFGTEFSNQILMPGDAQDQGYYSDSVTAHELGHHTMFSFGRAVGEGGSHCVASPDTPGLAWSEGFATWFSSDARGSSLYVDKQFGTTFWFDIGARSYYDNLLWKRAVAAAGLTQLMDENEISAMMWNISKVQAMGHSPLDTALTSARMKTPPFERGYTAETSSFDTSTCTRSNVQSTGVSTTYFADFLDALVCDGVSATVVNSATNPNVNFPYPSGAPRCR